MRAVRPKLNAPQVTIAEEQGQFLPITAALVRHPGYPAVETPHGPMNSIVLAFRPSEEDRAALAAGADLYVSLLTFGRPMPGLIVHAGPEKAAVIYNTAMEEA